MNWMKMMCITIPGTIGVKTWFRKNNHVGGVVLLDTFTYGLDTCIVGLGYWQFFFFGGPRYLSLFSVGVSFYGRDPR